MAAVPMTGAAKLRKGTVSSTAVRAPARQQVPLLHCQRLGGGTIHAP